MLIVGGCALYRARGDMALLMGRALRALGTSLSLGSFLFLPWVVFAPGEYLLNVLRSVPGGYVVDLVPLLFRILGLREMERALSLMQSLGGLPGWLLFMVPTFDWLLRLTLLSVPLVAGVSLLWLMLTCFITPQEEVRRIVGLVQAFVGTMVALLLLLRMPAMDSIGHGRNVYLRALVVLSGVQLASGAWLAWLGLVVLTIGSGIEAMSEQPLQQVQRRPVPVRRKSGSTVSTLPALMCGVGAVAILCSVVLIPWLYFRDQQPSMARIASGVPDARIRVLLEYIDPIMKLPARGPILALAQARSSLIGWALWRAHQITAGWLGRSIVLSAIVAAVGLLWAALAWFTGTQDEWLGWVSLVNAGVAVLLFIMLAGYVPAVDTFGIRGDFGVVWACLLTQTQAGPGIWFGLFGLLLIAVGGGMYFIASKGGSLW